MHEWFLKNSFDAGVLPAFAFVDSSCEPPLRLTNLQDGGTPWLSPRVASAAPAASFKSLSRRNAATPGSVVPPHWHPTDQRVVVLRGTMDVGMGEVLDR